MEILETYQLILKAGKTTTERALELFDMGSIKIYG
jgi:FlaA1/EpsC-like NDP-sugar epimerase